MRYPAYSNNSSLARSNLLARVCIDAAAKPRTYVAMSKIQYRPTTGSRSVNPYLSSTLSRLALPRLTSPCLANATQVTGKRLANAILARIRVKARGYGTDFRVKAKRPRGTSPTSHSTFLACKLQHRETVHTSRSYISPAPAFVPLRCCIRMRSWPLKLYVESYYNNILGEDIFIAFFGYLRHDFPVFRIVLAATTRMLRSDRSDFALHFFNLYWNHLVLLAYKSYLSHLIFFHRIFFP